MTGAMGTMRRMMLVALAAGLAVPGCRSGQGRAAVPRHPVVPAVRGELIDRLAADGRLEFAEIVEVGSTLSGTVTWIAAEDAVVAEGDPIASVRGRQGRSGDVPAPRGGAVVRRHVDAGESVLAGFEGGPALVSIASAGRFVARCDVAEVDVQSWSEDRPAMVMVQAFPGDRLEGRVRRISRMGRRSPGTHMVSFEAVVDLQETPDRLRHGMSCVVEVPTYVEKEVVSLPLQAVVMEGLDAASWRDRGPVAARAWVCSAEDLAGADAAPDCPRDRLRPVGLRISRGTESRVVVRSGLRAGDLVAADASAVKEEAE